MKRKFLCLLLSLFMLCAMLPVSSGLAAQSYSTGVVNADGVAFRKGASSDSGRIRRLKKGTVVEILATNVNAEWHKVKYKSETGYISRMYVTLRPSAEGVSYRGTVVNCKENVNVRGTADKKGTLLGTADKGASFTVKQANLSGGWHEIDYNGKTGYISADYLALAVAGGSGQLSSLTVSGGTLYPDFAPDVYGYVVEASSAELKVSVSGSGKLSVGDTGKDSAKISMPKYGSKTIRISVGGKVKYSLYIVRNVITVGTWNIKRGNGNLVEMGRLVEMQQPDLMGLQEVYRTTSKASSGTVNNLLSLRTKDMQNTSFASTIAYGGGGEYGVGLLSAYKIESTDSLKLSSGDGEQRVLQKIVVKINGRRVSVYNTHFAYDSAATRAKQFAEVRKVLDADKNKYKILFGDFNAKASEFSRFGSDYTVLNTTDTRFYDYDASSISKNEIDNIVVSDNITVLNVRMIDSSLSDHKPIFAYLKLG